MRILLIASVLLLTSGCYFAGVQPRTGETTGAGRFAAGGQVTAFTHAPGHYDLESEDFDRRSFDASFGARDSLGALVLGGLQLGGAYGITDYLEASASIGWYEQSAELRLAVLDEDAGCPLSLSVGAGGGASLAWYPHDQTWGARGGLAASMRLDTFTPFVNAWYGRALESYAPNHIPEQYDRTTSELFSPGDYPNAQRIEQRVTWAVGAAFPVAGGVRLLLSWVPYVVVAEEDVYLDCDGCTRAATAFDSDWAGVVLGMQTR